MNQSEGKKVFIAVEGRGDQEFLKALIQKFFPEKMSNVSIREFGGKQNLAKELPAAIRWRSPDDWAVVVLHDLDSKSHEREESRLRKLCSSNNWPKAAIHFAIQELEAWFLAEVSGLNDVFPQVGQIDNKAWYKKSGIEAVPNSKERLEIATNGEYTLVQGARDLGNAFDPARCKSPSFQIFWKSVCDFLA